MQEAQEIKRLNKADTKRLMVTCCCCEQEPRTTTKTCFCMNPECELYQIPIVRNLFYGKMDPVKQKVHTDKFTQPLQAQEMVS